MTSSVPKRLLSPAIATVAAAAALALLPGSANAQYMGFDRAFGIGVDTGAEALENCTNASGCQTGKGGEAAGAMDGSKGVAVDAQGRILVADDFNNRIDRFAVQGDGTVAFDRAFGIGVNTGGSGFENCTAASGCQAGRASEAAGGMERPQGVVVDGQGRILVADQLNDRINRYTTQPDGTVVFDRAFGPGVDTGSGWIFENCTTASGCEGGWGGSDEAGDMTLPQDVAVDAQGRILVTDLNGRVSRFTVQGDGTVAFDRAFGIGVNTGGSSFENCTTASGCQDADNWVEFSAGELGNARGITVDAQGRILVVSHYNRVSRYTVQGDGTVAFDRAFGRGVDTGGSAFENCTTASGCQQGAGSSGAGHMLFAWGVATDEQGRILVADTNNNRVNRYMDQADGTIAFDRAYGVGVDTSSPFGFGNCTAASGCVSGIESGDAGAADTPIGIAVDAGGGVLVAEAGNDRISRFVASTPPDTTPPDTTITSGPTGTTSNSSPSFGFTSSEAGSTFECRLDSGAWSACSSPKSYSSLPDGPHTFSVRATDSAGNTDTSPASRSFTVDTISDTTPPNTTITSGPADGAKISGDSVSFGFSSNEAGSTFECRLQPSLSDWKSCKSPQGYTLGSSEGMRTFAVRATDQAGNTDPSPATRSFTVDTTPSGPGPEDTTIDGAVSAQKTQKQKGKKIVVKARVSASEDLSATGSGKIKIAKKSYKLKKQTKRVSPGSSKNLKLAPKKKHGKKIAKALKQGKKATAKLTVKLSDEAGNKKVKNFKVKLKR